MPAVKIRDNIYWVGAIDYSIRNFHGYLTPMGSTYNAYLVMDEKISLIDTVKAPFTDELLKNIAEIIDPARIDYLISNHVEPDHSGALPALKERCPNAEVITSPNGLKGLSAYYGDEGYRFRVVKTGESLCTGRYTFDFVLMPMVHWPDSMSTYLREEQILFSNDAFGQHIACEERFDDEIAKELLLERAGDYYANIVLPFGLQVHKLLADTQGLPISLICPSHGVMLRSEIAAMVEKYAYWSAGKSNDRYAVIAFDSMWGATKALARDLAEKYRAEGIHTRMFDMATTHVSTFMAAALEAGTVAIGSPTLNRGVMHTVAALLSYFKGLAPKNRVGQAFGAYGWSGESVGIIHDTLAGLGYEMREPIKVQWR